MSVCGQSGQTDDDSGPEEVTATAAVRDNYKQKPVSKVVRVLTVLAYLLSVSLAAILLSVYYVCVWKSPELPPLNDTGAGGGSDGDLSAQRARDFHYMPAGAGATHHFTGGSDSGVNALVEPAAVNDTNIFSNTSVVETSTNSSLEESAATTTDATTPLNNTFDFGTNDTDTIT